jgi:hypothetical protein
MLIYKKIGTPDGLAKKAYKITEREGWLTLADK